MRHRPRGAFSFAGGERHDLQGSAGAIAHAHLRSRHRLHHRTRPRARLRAGRTLVRRGHRIRQCTEEGGLGGAARRHLGGDGRHRNGGSGSTLATLQRSGLPPHRRLCQRRASDARASRRRRGTAAEIDRYGAQPVRAGGASGYRQLPCPRHRQSHRSGRQGERPVARADQARARLRRDRG